MDNSVIKSISYSRVAAEGISALNMKIDLFTAAERPKRILVSKCTFTGRLRAIFSIQIEFRVLVLGDRPHRRDNVTPSSIAPPGSMMP